MTNPDRAVGAGGSGGSTAGCCNAELIDAYVDGAVSDAERQLAEQRIAACRSCRDEARRLSALRELLAAERVSPEPGAVIGLRPAAPVARYRAAAAAVAGLAAVFGGAAALLAALVPAAGSAAAAAATVFDFVITVGLLGAGLLDASWRGLNAAVSSALAPAAPALLFGGAAAIGLTAVLFSLLRRGSRASARQQSER